MGAKGSVEVICGGMFSGKTEGLILRLRRAVLARQTVQLFKPTLDDRYAVDAVVSHSGHSLPSVAVTTAKDIEDRIDPATQVVGVDEAQFFDQGIVELAERLANRGVRVIFAGLNQDYQGRPFGPMSELMSRADDLMLVHAVCLVCGDAASKTFRTAASTDQNLIGAEDAYEARCRKCYNSAEK